MRHEMQNARSLKESGNRSYEASGVIPGLFFVAGVKKERMEGVNGQSIVLVTLTMQGCVMDSPDPWRILL